MAKQQGSPQRLADVTPRGPGRHHVDPVGLATLAGVVGLLMISYASMRDIDRVERSLSERLSKLETQITQLASRPQQAQAPAQQGPDPNRVYTIRVANAPVRGPAAAPITIAEFSDFQ
jgi:protein-disulfide isomerase